MTTLEQALGNPNAQKYLRMIAQAEGTYKDASSDPYRVAFGGSTFDDLSKHPKVLRDFKQTDGKTNKTSAAGAYQFLGSTWDDVAGKLGLQDFSPRSQDLAALELIRRAGALDDVLNGRFDQAVQKTGTVWASLPSSPYAQPRRSAGFVEKALNTAIPSAQAADVDAEIDAFLSNVQTKAAAPVQDVDAEIDAFLGQSSAQAKQDPKPKPKEGSAITAFGAGVGAGVGQAVLGLQNLVGKGAEALGAERVGQWLQEDSRQGRAKLKGEMAEYEAHSPTSSAVGEVGGNIAATLPVGGLLGKGVQTLGSALGVGAKVAPVAQALTTGGTGAGLGLGARVAGGAGTGAVTGAILDSDNIPESMTLGAALGGAFPVAMRGVQRVINPNAANNEALQLLRKEGVRPTLGQSLGGLANRAEEKLTSVPVLGDAIRSSRNKAVEQFNKAALNRALKPIGESVDKIGREGIDEVASKLGQAYDDLVPKLQFMADDVFDVDLQRLVSMADGLEPKEAARFTKLVQEKVVGKLSKAGGMTGETFKQVEADLGKLAKTFTGSPMASDKLLGNAVMELQDTLRRTLERSNPQQAKQLKAINEGYANYVRLRQAAGVVGAEDGIFTPGQLTNAVKASDKSAGKGNFARGKAKLQDLSDAGKIVLGNKVPDSGTAERLLPSAALLGSGAINMGIPLSVLGGSMAYTPALQRALVGAVASRPQSAQAVSEGFRKGSSVLVRGAVPLGAYVSGNP